MRDRPAPPPVRAKGKNVIGEVIPRSDVVEHRGDLVRLLVQAGPRHEAIVVGRPARWITQVATYPQPSRATPPRTSTLRAGSRMDPLRILLTLCVRRRRSTWNASPLLHPWRRARRPLTNHIPPASAPTRHPPPQDPRSASASACAPPSAHKFAWGNAAFGSP